MNRWEIFERMEEIINKEVADLVPGKISDYLIEAPVNQRLEQHVELKITARQLKWNTWLGGVAQNFPIYDFECLYPELREGKKAEVSPYMWERFTRNVHNSVELMLLKLIRMIKEADNGKTDGQ